MTIPKENRTPKYMNAVKALTALANEDSRWVVDAFAEVREAARLEEFRRQYGVEQSKEPASINWLLGRSSEKMSPLPPGCDHYSAWTKDGKPYAFVFQPYELRWEKLQKLIRFCQTRDLEVSIDGHLSWYFPGETFLVVITRKEETDNN